MAVQLLRPANPTHRHYKGGLYREITSRVRRETDGVRMVLYEDEKGQLWVRTYEEFVGNVLIEKDSGSSQLLRRFRPISGEQPE